MKAGLDVIAVGATSAIGLDLSAHLSLGKEPVSVLEEEFREGIEHFCGRLRIRSAGQLKVRPLLKTPKTEKFLTREMCLTLHAAAEVSELLPAVEKHRVGVVLATAPTISSLAEIAEIREHCVIDSVLQPSLLAADIPRFIPATWPSRSLKATMGCHLATEFGWVGPNLTVSPYPLSGLSTIGISELLLSSGAADIVLAGAGDSRVDNLSAAEAVYRRCKRLKVNCISDKEMPVGVTEGAAILALARVGEYPKVVARLRAYQEVHLSASASGQALVKAFHNLLNHFNEMIEFSRFDTLWVDLNPDLNPVCSSFEELVEGVNLFHRHIDVRHEIGDPGISVSSLALAVACTQPTLTPSGSDVVVSIHDKQFIGILVEKAL